MYFVDSYLKKKNSNNKIYLFYEFISPTKSYELRKNIYTLVFAINSIGKLIMTNGIKLIMQCKNDLSFAFCITKNNK